MTITDTAIEGVKLIQCVTHRDDRGAFTEVFRASWFNPRPWLQWNLSQSKANVLRGLHFHRKQSDYWVIPQGRVIVAMADLRPKSVSYRKAVCLELNADNCQGLIIPPGVCHGYRAITDATVMYLVDQEYDGKDEYGVTWSDPALGLPQTWYTGPTPLLSGRDAKAPLLAQVDVSGL